MSGICIGDENSELTRGRLKLGETRGIVYLRQEGPDGRHVLVPYLDRARFTRRLQDGSIGGPPTLSEHTLTPLSWAPASSTEGSTPPALLIRGEGWAIGEAAERRAERDRERFLRGKDRNFPLPYAVVGKLRGEASSDGVEADGDETEPIVGVAK